MSVFRELEEQRRKAVAMRFGTDTPVQIANELKIHWATVYRIARRLGLMCNGNQKRAESNTSCDIHYFDRWSSNMAYILGFSFADGSVNGNVLSLEVTEKDECVLKFIRKELKALPIRHYAHHQETSPGTKPSCRLTLNSKVLIEQVKQLGLRSRKTYHDDPFPKVPDEFFGDFIRGYFDGDGSVSVRLKKGSLVRLIGTPKFIEGIHDGLIRLAGMQHKVPSLIEGKNAVWSVVGWSNPNDLRAFYRLVYPQRGFDFCLQRKRQKLFDWLTLPRIEMKTSYKKEKLCRPIW